MNRTQSALIARGIDSQIAYEAIKAGWTVGKLKQATDARLKSIGFSTQDYVLIRQGARPPIPSQTVSKLLFDNRYQCCVCRDPKKPFTIHHIEEWAASRSHDISNLAVLCLEHHNKAHSTSTLSQNLDRKTLLDIKVAWEEEVKRLDARSIIDSFKGEYAHWAFINELRLFELADEHAVNKRQVRGFARAVQDKILDKDGSPLPVRTGTFYKYEGASILTRYGYMKALLEEVISDLHIINISDYLDKDVIVPAVVPGDFVVTQGVHTFTPIHNVKRGIGQTCRGVRRANSVEIRFVFDRWEAASSSSKNDWLVGTKCAASLIQVRDVTREDGRVVLTGTVLGIASFLNGLKTRDYDRRWVEWWPRKRLRRSAKRKPGI